MNKETQVGSTEPQSALASLLQAALELDEKSAKPARFNPTRSTVKREDSSSNKEDR